MTVKELIQQLNKLIKTNSNISEMKVCGENSEFDSKFVYEKIVILNFDWSENFNWNDEVLPSNKEEILVLR